MKLLNTQELANIVKDFIKNQHKDITEVEKYGGYLYGSKGYDHFCGVFAYKDHVNVEFSFGYKLKDPKKILKGSGKYRRHLKFQEIRKLDLETIKYFVNQSYKMNKVEK